MRLPSIGFVAQSARASAGRFPYVLAASLVAAYAAMSLVNSHGESADKVRLLLPAVLGLSLLFALTLLAERRVNTPLARAAAPMPGVLVLVAVWAAWPGWSTPVQALRYAQLAVAFHLLVAFLPYAGYAEANGFWHYNKGLLLRFVTAALYSAVLYAGLALALVAVDKLLGIHIPGETYPRLWIVIAFVFNTWFFVSGVPRGLEQLESWNEYPTELRMFSQYILVPIVAIYLAILTLYLGKVLITRQWPSGWIGYLVSSVASVGTLSWLLVYPLEAQPEYAWVKRFTRGFYLVLLPSIVMLWFAIGKRVAQYGITEPRYFLIVLSVWLAGIAVYYSVSRSRSIKLIPASLAGVALITFAGPWGAYSVSRASQTGRLRSVLVRNALLANDTLVPATREVSFDDRRELSAGFRYLLETHGRRSIERWLTDSLKRVVARGGKGEPAAQALLGAIHVDYVNRGQSNQGRYFGFYAQQPAEALAITGYDYAMAVSLWRVRDSLRIAGTTFVKLGADSMSLRVVRDGGLLLEIPLASAADSVTVTGAQPSRALSRAPLRVEVGTGDTRALLFLTQLNGTREPRRMQVTAFEGELFLKLPQ
ncbi:MAG TPA: DUF4153 domain-containing protein [Gemmatimonadales bacterium]|nr:DUF4153 domain-containing protein [Gemmatimonadales bacterium]